MISSALAALQDNPYTRFWNNAVTDTVIKPVERLVGGAGVVADDTLARLAARIDAEVETTGGLADKTQAMLSTYVDPTVNWNEVAQRVRENIEKGKPVEDRVAGLQTALLARTNYVAGKNVTPEQAQQMGIEATPINETLTEALRSEIVGDRQSAYTEGGNIVRQYVLASPMASYLAGGTGLAAAINGAIGWAEALDPQGEMKPTAKKKKEEEPKAAPR